MNSCKTWIVDPNGGGDTVTIQAAIDVAESGDAIYIKAGTYYEHINIEKSLTLVGEDRNKTIIDGTYSGRIISINTNNVIVENLTLMNSGWGIFSGAIYVSGNSYNITVFNNTLINNNYGVCADPQSWVRISDNLIVGNDTYRDENNESIGLMLMSDYCSAEGNLIENLSLGIMVNGNYNLIHNNTIIGHLYSDPNKMLGNIAGLTSVSNKRLNFYTQKVAQYNNITCNTIQGYVFTLNLINIKGWLLVQNNILGGYGFGTSQTYYNQWDLGYPVGGNYWGARLYADQYSGVYQNITGADGISDRSIALYQYNNDNYPLIHQIINFTFNPAIPVPPYQKSTALPTYTPTPTPVATFAPTPAPLPTTATSTPKPTQTPTKQPTQLRLFCQKENDTALTITGSLLSGNNVIPNALIQIAYSNNMGSTWTNLTVTTTDLNGNLSITRILNVPGSYLINATYNGSNSYEVTSTTAAYVATQNKATNPSNTLTFPVSGIIIACITCMAVVGLALYRKNIKKSIPHL